MLTARINLEGTKKGDLLLSSLVEKANSYTMTLNGESEKIMTKGKEKFTIKTNDEGKIMSVNVSPEMPTDNTGVNVRVDVYRKEDNNGETSIVVTIDEPYVVIPDSTRKRLVVVNTNTNDNGRSENIIIKEAQEI